MTNMPKVGLMIGTLVFVSVLSWHTVSKVQFMDNAHSVLSIDGSLPRYLGPMAMV